MLGLVLPSATTARGFTGSVTPPPVIATILVGTYPAGVAVDPAAHRAVVTDEGSNTVSVLDTRTASVLATILVGNTPQAVALDPLTHRAYVANADDNTLSVLDTSRDADLDARRRAHRHGPRPGHSTASPDRHVPRSPDASAARDGA